MPSTFKVEVKEVFGSKDKVAQFSPTGDTNFPREFAKLFGVEMLTGKVNVRMPEGEISGMCMAEDWLIENDWVK